MKLNTTFDANQVAPSAPQEVLPPAFYPVTITGSERKQTSKKDGYFLALEMTVIDGQYKGRKIFDNLNLENKNPQAVQIAQETLSAICHATGVMVVEDSAQLHNIPLEVKVGMAKPTTEYPDPSNEVKGYRKLEGTIVAGAPVALPVSLPPVTETAAIPAAAMPWQVQTPPVVETAVAAAPAAVEAPAPAPIPAPVPVVAPVVVQPIKTMTAKAGGATYEAFITAGWTDEKMVAGGYMTIETPAPASVAAVPAAGEIPPPWAQ